MRLPYKVKDFKSIQRNFDYLVGFLTGKISFVTATQAGPFIGTNTNWTSPVAGKALCLAFPTSFSPAAATPIVVNFSINGVAVAAPAFLNNALTPNVHLSLAPAIGVVDVVKGTNTWNLNQVSGTSDGNDGARVIFVVVAP